MPEVLILYGTTEGHTRSVAEALARTLRLGDHRVHVIDVAEGDPNPCSYGAVIVAASVHAGGYQTAVQRWVRRHATELAARPTAFVSVCLAILQRSDPKVMDDLNAIVRRFSDKTGWRPCHAHSRIERMATTSAAASPAVDQCGDRWTAGVGAGRRSARVRRSSAATAPS